MSKRDKPKSSAPEKLESIHRRMAGVTEDEALAALKSSEEASTRGAATAITITCIASEGKTLCASALTRIA